MIVVVALTSLVLANALREPAQRAVAAVGLATIATGMLAGHLLNDWLVTNSYAGRGGSEVDTATSSIDHLGGMLSALRNLVGQGGTCWSRRLAWRSSCCVFATPRAVARLRRGAGEPGRSCARADRRSNRRLARRVRRLARGPDAPGSTHLRALHGARCAGASGTRRRDALRIGALAARSGARDDPRHADARRVAALRVGLDVTEETSRWNVASLPSVTGTLTAPVLVLGGMVAAAALAVLLAVRSRRPAAVGAAVVRAVRADDGCTSSTCRSCAPSTTSTRLAGPARGARSRSGVCPKWRTTSITSTTSR